MKKIFTSSVIILVAALLFAGCKKEKPYLSDNSYWLSQERGDVVYSNNSCGYYVVETNYGYTIIRNMDGLRTYDGDIMYGNFGGYGSRNFYNYTADVVTRGSVVEYDLSYNAAQDAIDYYCPYGRAGGPAIRQSDSAAAKAQRKAAPANE
ncbi:MAG: hypothetical protein U0V75_03230 [Ferruginibacter sp.]